MPTPLIELQRRLSLVGAIRAGGEQTNPKRPGAKLEHWRITSPRKTLVEQAAALYGGSVTPWTSPVGAEWQCYTAADELPVLLMPSYSLRQSYELWEGATKRTRLCDGVDEELSGGPCICNAEGEDKCDLYTRLVVALPELDTLLGWRVITRGANAAHELPTMVDAARATSSRPFVPARLRLEQRRGVVDGQVARFVVPTLDLGVGYAALAAAAVDGSTLQLPRGDALAGVATAPREQPTIEQASSAAEPVPSGGQAALGADNDEHEQQQQQTKLATIPMKRKLDVLVGTLREQGHVKTDGLYDAVGTRLRDTAGLDLAMTTPDYVDDKGVVHKAIDEDGTTHWAPLRETLTRPEALQLIDWLTKVEARAAAGSGAGDEPAAQAGSSDATPDPAPQTAPEPPDEAGDDQPTPPIPYNEFPPGY